MIIKLLCESLPLKLFSILNDSNTLDIIINLINQINGTKALEKWNEMSLKMANNSNNH